MRSLRKLCAVGAIATLLTVYWTSAADARGRNADGATVGSARVLASDLSSPKGLAVNHDKGLVVAQGAFGPPGPVLVFARDKGVARPLKQSPIRSV